MVGSPQIYRSLALHQLDFTGHCQVAKIAGDHGISNLMLEAGLPGDVECNNLKDGWHPVVFTPGWT